MAKRSGFDDFALVGFVASAAAILALAAADYWASTRQVRAAEWVTHSHEVRAGIASARSDLLEILSVRDDPPAQRLAVMALETELARLRDLTRDSPDQARRIEALDESLRAQLPTLDRGDVARAITRLSSLDGEEQRLLGERVRDEARTLTWFHLTSAVAIVVMLLVLSVLYVLEQRRRADRDAHLAAEQRFHRMAKQAESELEAEVEEKRIAEEALREMIASLETVVAERTSLLEAAVAALSDAKRRLEEQAQHDPLTGLPNRRLLIDRLKQATSAARRRERCVGVLFVDLDRFKEVNDTRGHDAGDTVLKEVARRMQACVREADTVAREGGDEFVVVLPDLEVPEDALRVAEKIVVELAKAMDVGGAQVRVTPSIGISHYPRDATDIEELIRRADQAMYSAKGAGRNTIRSFH
ncbi:MAG TPA: diguanylate cyclase [Usitatibacter sp.]|nr:diguanylate cyclase [Usitatibacter sp.]